jgi:hypothetical protein
LHLTELDKLIATASTLPLLDAAYTLWLYSNDPWLTKDDAWDFQGGSSTETIDHSGDPSTSYYVKGLRMTADRDESACTGPSSESLQ